MFHKIVNDKLKHNFITIKPRLYEEESERIERAEFKTTVLHAKFHIAITTFRHPGNSEPAGFRK